MLPLPGGAGLAPVLNDARRLADFTLPAGTFKRITVKILRDEKVLATLITVRSNNNATN